MMFGANSANCLASQSGGNFGLPPGLSVSEMYVIRLSDSNSRARADNDADEGSMPRVLTISAPIKNDEPVVSACRKDSFMECVAIQWVGEKLCYF